MTLLERLQPQEQDAGIGSRPRGVSFEDSIARDLEMVLNTRREEFLVPAEFVETSSSIVNFGIPDLSTCGSLRSNAEQAKLCRWISEAINSFEPRLCNVSVQVIERENVAPVMRFRIEAKAELTAERISFELGLKRDSGRVNVLSR
jgi:type VI secretion system protein ImpF